MLHIDAFQSIRAVERSMLAHCANVHTVCREGAEGYFIESARLVCVQENTKCAVCGNYSTQKA